MMNLAFYSALLSLLILLSIAIKHIYDKYKLRKMIKGAVNTLNPSALHRRRSRETPAAMGIPIRRRQVPGILIESRRSSIVRRKSLDNAMLLDDHAARLHAYGPKREMKATAGRAFDLCTILHQLTEAEQRFKNTNRITEPPIVRAARKWKRLALRNKEKREQEKESKKWMPRFNLNLEHRMREYVSGLCKSSPNSIITLFFAKDFTPNETPDDSDDQRKSREPTWACPVTLSRLSKDELARMF